jgi:hypothetical protein
MFHYSIFYKFTITTKTKCKKLTTPSYFCSSMNFKSVFFPQHIRQLASDDAKLWATFSLSDIFSIFFQSDVLDRKLIGYKKLHDFSINRKSTTRRFLGKFLKIALKNLHPFFVPINATKLWITYFEGN